MNPARSGFELGRLRERQRKLASAFQRDDAPRPLTGRCVTRPAALEPCGERDIAIGGFAFGVDLRLMVGERAFDIGAETPRGDRVRAQRSHRQRKPKRSIGSSANLAFGLQRGRRKRGSGTQAVAVGGECDGGSVPRPGDPASRAEVPGEPCIERRGIARIQREGQRVAGASEIAVEAQPIRADAQRHMRITDTAWREREFAGSGERTAAQGAVAAELE